MSDAVFDQDPILQVEAARATIADFQQRVRVQFDLYLQKRLESRRILGNVRRARLRRQDLSARVDHELENYRRKRQQLRALREPLN